MWERTITISSAGKSLWVTGWKCGWAIGPELLINRMVLVHQQIVEYYITPIQVGNQSLERKNVFRSIE